MSSCQKRVPKKSVCLQNSKADASTCETTGVWPALKKKVQTKYSSHRKMKCVTGERRGFAWTHCDQTDEQLQAQKSKFSCYTPMSRGEVNSTQVSEVQNVEPPPKRRREGKNSSTQEKGGENSNTQENNQHQTNEGRGESSTTEDKGGEGSTTREGRD